MVIGSASLRDTTEGVGTMAKADLKHYQDAEGHVYSVTDADARLMGLTKKVKLADLRVTGPSATGDPRDRQGADAALVRRVADLEAKLATMEAGQAEAKGGARSR